MNNQQPTTNNQQPTTNCSDNEAKFKEKYKFLKKLDKSDIKHLTVFLMSLLLDVALGTEKGESKVDEFITDAKNAMRD